MALPISRPCRRSRRRRLSCACLRQSGTIIAPDTLNLTLDLRSSRLLQGMGFTPLPAHLQTADGDHVFSGSGHVAQLNELVASVRAANDASPLFLCAHSMGGVIATLFAAQYPALVAGVRLASFTWRSSCIRTVRNCVDFFLDLFSSFC